MLWPNLNSPDVLWKKLNRVRLCNCVNSHIFRATQGWEGQMEKELWIFLIELNPAYFVAKFELARCFMEKVEQGQRLCNCVKSNFWGLPTGKRRVEEGGLSIVLIDLNPIYVLVKLELGTYANYYYYYYKQFTCFHKKISKHGQQRNKQETDKRRVNEEIKNKNWKGKSWGSYGRLEGQDQLSIGQVEALID